VNINQSCRFLCAERVYKVVVVQSVVAWMSTLLLISNLLLNFPLESFGAAAAAPSSVRFKLKLSVPAMLGSYLRIDESVASS